MFSREVKNEVEVESILTNSPYFIRYFKLNQATTYYFKPSIDTILKVVKHQSKDNYHLYEIVSGNTPVYIGSYETSNDIMNKINQHVNVNVNLNQ